MSLEGKMTADVAEGNLFLDRTFTALARAVAWRGFAARHPRDSVRNAKER
jgi:hypothetical protein